MTCGGEGAGAGASAIAASGDGCLGDAGEGFRPSAKLKAGVGGGDLGGSTTAGAGRMSTAQKVLRAFRLSYFHTL